MFNALFSCHGIVKWENLAIVFVKEIKSEFKIIITFDEKIIQLTKCQFQSYSEKNALISFNKGILYNIKIIYNA